MACAVAACHRDRRRNVCCTGLLHRGPRPAPPTGEGARAKEHVEAYRALLFGAGPGARSHTAEIGAALHLSGRFDLALVHDLGLLVGSPSLKGKLDIVALDSASQL